MALRLHAFFNITITILFLLRGRRLQRLVCRPRQRATALARLPSARLLTTWEQYTPYAAASKAVFSMYITLQLLFMAIHAMYLHQLHTCSRQIETATGISLCFALPPTLVTFKKDHALSAAASPRHVRMSSRRLACLNSS